MRTPMIPKKMKLLIKWAIINSTYGFISTSRVCTHSLNDNSSRKPEVTSHHTTQTKCPPPHENHHRVSPEFWI